MRAAPFLLATLTLAAAACNRPATQSLKAGDSLSAGLGGRLPTGVHLDPAAPVAPIWSMALTMRTAPEGDRVVVSSSSYDTQGLQVIDATTGNVLQELPQRSAFVGLAFSPDGKTLYASGGDADVVYRYDWSGGRATLRDSIRLDEKTVAHGYRYPAGLAVSPDGRHVYVAEDLSDSLAVIDAASGSVVQRVAAGHYPYDVVAAPNGRVYVSAWGGYSVAVYRPTTSGTLGARHDVLTARHPSSLQLNADGSRLYAASGSTDHVAVIDTRRERVISRLLDPPPAGPGEGSTPDGLALSADGTRLFVAEADANAVAVFDLSAATSNVATAKGDDRLRGRVPTAWYPTAVVTRGGDLLIAAGKGMGTRANPQGPQPIIPPAAREAADRNRTLAQLAGGFMRVPLARTGGAELASLDHRVTVANGWNDSTARAHKYPPFEHVIYVIKENRTYDQVFGDLRQADGDTALEFFPRPVSPNHHALAERFGIFDRFFVNAEVSPDGHNWSTAAYATDYLEKTVPSNYSGRGRSYDYEGTNGGFGMRDVPDDDVAEPANGYLWNLAERKGITFRNYGEFVVPSGADPDDPLPEGYRGNKPFLYAHTNPTYPGFDLGIKDQHRADVWLAEFQQYVKRDSMPALEIIRLPNDHTSGARAGMPTPRAAFADNDLALGRMVDALSHSQFWKNTVMFVLEDDAQNGPDHVDSHRSPMMVISAYTRGGVIHRFANTTDVLRTMEEILGLSSMSQFDYFGRPLRDIWSSRPDLTPYTARVPAISLDERNPGGTRNARDSEGLDLHVEDVANEALFNRILWRAIKGDAVPYPGTRRLSARDLKIGY
jgi:YVTN family beta-propeller protein